MAKCSERVVNAAVNQGKVACFHEDCKESYKFFKEDGIVHHFKTTHHRKNVHLSEILQRAKQFTAQRHGDETALFLHSKFELLFREVSKEKFYRISLDVTFVVYLSYCQLYSSRNYTERRRSLVQHISSFLRSKRRETEHQCLLN